MKLENKSKKKFIIHFILVIIFSLLYWISSFFEVYYKLPILDNRGNYTQKKAQPIGFYQCFYFSLITQTTVGYGYHPSITLVSKGINVLQLFSIILLYLS